MIYRFCKGIFSLGEIIILYDLTNTYFSGNATEYKKAKRGRSKQKRSDRPLVTLGVVLDERGFIKCSRIVDGNVGEPLTLVDMINDIHSQVSRETPPFLVTKPTIVMDAGIASEDNLDLVRGNGFSYIVVSRSKPEHIEDGSFEQMKEGIKAREMRSGKTVITIWGKALKPAIPGSGPCPYFCTVCLAGASVFL